MRTIYLLLAVVLLIAAIFFFMPLIMFALKILLVFACVIGAVYFIIKAIGRRNYSGRELGG